MDSDTVEELLEDLADHVDNLEECLAPVLKAALAITASKLPLLDKAKMYVTVTYTIESLLFSLLRLHGVNARTHPVFAELSRVKEYFAKITRAENGPEKRTAVLDKDAAGRFVKNGLTGNVQYDHDRAEREARGTASAHTKMENLSASSTHTKFDTHAKQKKSLDTAKRDVTSPEAVAAAAKKLERKAAKHRRRAEARLAKQSPADSSNKGVD